MILNKKIISVVVMVLLTLQLHAKKEETVELNFVNTPISHLTKLISELTGNNFVSDGEIPGNFTFVSQKPIKKSNLMSVYEMILRTKGYMIVNHEDKGFFMITRNNNPQRENIEFDKKENNYEVKTEIIDLKYFTPSKIRNIIQPYFTSSGKVVANDDLGFVMVTDYHDSIQKIKQIIKKVDTPVHMQTKRVKLDNVNTKNVFAQVQKLAQVISDKYRKPIKVLEDKVTNSILISYQGRQEFEDLKKMILDLDANAHDDLRSEVVYLKNSKAEEIVKIVQGIEKNRYEVGAIADKEQVSISHDKSLNAIILMGQKNAIGKYQNIIEDLDTPKKQIYVQAQIVEVNQAKAREIGVRFDNFMAADVGDGVKVLQGNINSGSSSALGTLSGLADTGELQDAFTDGFSIGAVLNLLEDKGATKVLSSPKLLALDNQESSIYVGENRPIATTQTQQQETTTVPVTSYKYKDIGLTLTITPQIMSDNKVRLDISTLLEDVAGTSGNNSELVSTTKREVKTTSIVDDGDEIVIAGLIRDKTDVSRYKVPFFGDIPFLGGMFRGKSSDTQRVNLLVVLRPTVVKDVTELPVESQVHQDEFDKNNEGHTQKEHDKLIKDLREEEW